MLSSEFKLCFKLMRISYWYLPKYIFEWDPDYTNIVISKSYLSWTVCILNFLDAILIATGNAYVVYTHYLVKPRPRFHLNHAFIFAAGSIAVVIVITVGLMMTRKRNELTKAFNHMFHLNTNMTKKYRPTAFDKRGNYNNDGKRDVIGLMATAMMVGLGTSLYWLVPLVIYRQFDCIHFILEDIFPEASKANTTGWKIFLHFSRAILVSPSIIEIIRSLSWFLAIEGIFGLSYLSVLQILNKMTSLTEFITNYNVLILTYKYIEWVLGDLLFIVITVDYFGTAGALGFLIVGYDKLNTLMVVFVAFAVMMAIVVTMVALVKVKTGMVMMEKLLKSRLVLVKLRQAKLRTRWALMIKCQMFCLRMIRVPYGSFFYLRKEFALEYFENLTGQVVDSVLMFDLR